MKKAFNEEEEEQIETHNHEQQEQHEPPVNGYVTVPEMRMLSLYGEVNEKRAADIVYSMHVYSRVKKIIPHDKHMPPKKFTESTEPLEFLISTPGGSATDMFSIYDTMNMVKKNMEIHTVGLGKVMSAGVLLMAAGTKGKRKIGRNCRVMIHSVVGGMAGSSHDIKNEMDEIMLTQKKYVEALAKETKLSVKEIFEFLDEKRNIYLSAKEAIKYGIADKLV